MDDYLAGLERAIKKMPATRETKERFVIPSVKVFYEGKTTVLENYTVDHQRPLRHWIDTQKVLG